MLYITYVYKGIKMINNIIQYEESDKNNNDSSIEIVIKMK